MKQALSVPVLANGGCFTPADVDDCLRATGADGVMCGEALLENPTLFEGGTVGEDQVSRARSHLGCCSILIG